MREQIAQALRVKDEAEQASRVSVASTDKEALARSALFRETPAESGMGLQTVVTVEGRTTPQTAVHPQEEMNRAAEPEAYSCQLSRLGMTHKRKYWRAPAVTEEEIECFPKHC